MIFRNSIKSIFRTPVKTLFFALLIAAVSAFFYLGVNTWMASAAMLADCDENHTTIVTIEYLDSGSNNTIGYKSDAMARDVAAIDFETIAANENVLLWQPADESLCLAAGFSTKSNDAEAGYNCVIIVTGVRQYSEGSYYSCKLVECLYSAREYRPGSTLFIESSARDFGFEPDANATYVILGKNIRANSMGGMSIRLNTFYSWPE